MTLSGVTQALRAAMSHHQAGDLTLAEQSYRQVLATDPTQADALHNLALIVHQRDGNKEAVRLLGRAVKARPDDASFWNNLANVLRADGRPSQAIDAYREALHLMPSHVSAHYNLGLALLDIGDSNEAAEAMRRGLEHEPSNADLWSGLGEALAAAQHSDQATSAFHTALRLDPHHAETLVNLGHAALDRGETTSAIETFRKALSLVPDMPEALAGLARCWRFSPEDSTEIDAMTRALENTDTLGRGEVLLHFSLGKVYDDCAQYEQAFEHYRLGNELKSRQNHFDATRHTDFVTRTMAVFDVLRLAQPVCDIDTERPVFIVGMPRSGTSLIEQIVASHPQAAGAGELAYLGKLCHGLSNELGSETPYPECVSDLTTRKGRRLAGGYLDVLGASREAGERVTDKMPTNFLYLGMIALLFPRAKIIHCEREPLDTCLSNYFQLYGPAQFFSYRFEDLVSYYQDYRRLMAHWREVLPIEIHRVVYEDLVEAQEKVSRVLIDYCGLPWDDACVSFQQTERRVHTASNWQVRQPVYQHSSGRWRHYEPYLPESILSLKEKPLPT